MPADVFLSYARTTSKDSALVVRKALVDRNIATFLDESDIDNGESFPERLVDALLAAKVIVIFADSTYFTRWYCLWEWRAARTPYLLGVSRSGHKGTESAKALRGLAIVLPPSGKAAELDRFPPLIREINWPSTTEPNAVADLVERLRGEGLPSLAERIEAAGGPGSAVRMRHELLEVQRLPQPLRLSGLRRVPLAFPDSLGEGFLGRADDLWRIDELLATRAGGVAGAAALMGAIVAGGGVGKTRLALEYAHRLGAQRFRGGVFWIDADQETALLDERYHEILCALDPGAPPLSVYRDPLSGRRLRDDLVRAFDTLPEKERALIILDNVPEPEPGLSPPSIEELCPVIGVGSVLITSRLGIHLGTGGTVNPIHLDVLDDASAVRLLTRSYDAFATVSVADWNAIAEWVGNLPLALVLLNSALLLAAVRPEELLALSRAEASTTRELDAAMEVLWPHVPSGALRGVTEALGVSYARLTSEAQQAARLLAHLAPQPIPEAVIAELGDLRPSASVRAELIARSIVTPGPVDWVPVFGQIHRVLADFVRTRGHGEAEKRERLIHALRAVMNPDACRDPAAWPLMRACLPHAEIVLRREFAVEAPPRSADAIVDLAASVGRFFAAQGLPNRALELDESLLTSAEHWLGYEHPRTLAVANNVAADLAHLGDFRGARARQEAILEVRRRLLGPEDPDTLLTMNNLAFLMHELGDFAGLRDIQATVLEVRSRKLGKEHVHTLNAQSNLASTLIELGDYEEGRKLILEALQTCVRLFGSEHPYTLTRMITLAGLNYEKRDFASALSLSEEAGQISKRVLGPEHPITLTALNGVAGATLELGDAKRAVALLDEVVGMSERTFGARHPETLSALNNLGEALRRSGDFVRARVTLHRAIDALTPSLGGAHPNTLRSLMNLALTHAALKDVPGIRSVVLTVLDSCRKLTSPAAPGVLRVLSDLARMAQVFGGLAEARQLELEHQRLGGVAP